VEKLCETAEEQSVSREALSLDISRLVSRVVSGEAIDTAEKGAALAAKYPDVGMSGELIGQAIERAAGMVGMIRAAPAAPKPSPGAAATRAAGGLTVANRQTANGHGGRAPAALPVAAQSIDDELAAAIDAEIGNLVSGQRTAPTAPATTNGERHPPAGDALRASTAREPAHGFFSRGSVAAFRRALFRT
jgi:hypothetical protein